jgi:prephenate dehydrogenase
LDMTRLALSAPDLWLSILASNRNHVLSALDQFLMQAEKLRKTIGKSEVAYSFATAAEFSSKIRKLDN